MTVTVAGTNSWAVRDTGYVSIDQSGTQETTIANSGSEIIIFVKSMVINFVTNIDNKPGAAYLNETSENPGVFLADIISAENPTIVVNGYFNVNNSAQLDNMKALERARRTRGIKEFYYKEDNAVAADANRRKNLADVFGTTDAQQSTYKHFHCYITQIQVPDTADKEGQINYQMTLLIVGS